MALGAGVVASAADCAYQQQFTIDADSSIPGCRVKRTHQYGNVAELLGHVAATCDPLIEQGRRIEPRVSHAPDFLVRFSLTDSCDEIFLACRKGFFTF